MVFSWYAFLARMIVLPSSLVLPYRDRGPRRSVVPYPNLPLASLTYFSDLVVEKGIKHDCELH